jgi:hypothetical protein
MIMVIFQAMGNLIGIIIAALIGNWVGGQIRFLLTGEPVQTIRFELTTHKGREISNFPVITKFYPALLISLIGKPRWLYSFIGGILMGVVLDDRFETCFIERVIEPLIIDRVLEDQNMKNIDEGCE